MDTGIAILISAAAATCGWFFYNRAQRQTNRRHQTFQIFHDYRLGGNRAEDITKIHDLVKANNLPDPYDQDRRNEVRLIDDVFNYYEFVAASVFNGDMDEAIVKSCEQSMITSFVKDLKPYVTASQENQPTVFNNLLALANRWENNHLTWLHRLYEWWKMRPYFELPIHVRWLNVRLSK